MRATCAPETERSLQNKTRPPSRDWCLPIRGVLLATTRKRNMAVRLTRSGSRYARNPTIALHTFVAMASIGRKRWIRCMHESAVGSHVSSLTRPSSASHVPIQDITSPRRCQYDMCGVLPAGVDPESDMSVQTLRGGLTAVYRCELDEVDLFFCCQTVFNWLTNEWLPGSGFKPDDRPVYKIFIEDPSQNRRGNYLFEFCAPVQPMTEPIRVV